MTTYKKATQKVVYAPNVPSREQILALLRQHSQTLSSLLRHFKIRNKDTQIGLKSRLQAMVRDGQLLCQRKRYRINEATTTITGTVSAHRDGFGFLIRDDGQPDLFLNEKEMLKVFHGDKVAVRLGPPVRTGKQRLAFIIEVLQRCCTQVLGRLYWRKGHWRIRPLDPKYLHEVMIDKTPGQRPENGQVVLVDIQQAPNGYEPPRGVVRRTIGNFNDPGIEIDIAIEKFGLPVAFSAKTEQQVAMLPSKVLAKDCRGREDCRHLPFITIDGEDARDFDDAIYVEPSTLSQGKRHRRCWRLMVAIADVSHYVPSHTPLDADAQERGTSVYFPRRVIPMLPEALSNGLCSLNPQVDRLVMMCDMYIAATGKQAGQVLQYRFYRSVIHSQARTTYAQVASILPSAPKAQTPLQHPLVHGVTPVDDWSPAVRQNIANAYALFKVLHCARKQRGAIDFDTVETQIISDADGRIERIVPRPRNDAHLMIEECMLAANTCAADLLQRHQKGGLFRVHEGPGDTALDSLRAYLKPLGLHLDGGDSPTPADYAALLVSAVKRPDVDLLQTMVLRSMKQARYVADNMGHFGLAYHAYTHFTSPIRRYPDLLVHRVIKGLLARRPYRLASSQAPAQVEGEQWAQLGDAMSVCERRADEASREVQAYLKCAFAQQFEGQVFEGMISSVCAFGIFVTLKDMYVEGLVSIRDLGQAGKRREYLRHDEVRHCLRSEKSGLRYQLGDPIRVRITHVDLESRRIMLSLA